MITNYRHISILFALLLSLWGNAQTNTQLTSLFNENNTLRISLKFDITTHVRQKSEEYCNSKLTVYQNPNDSISYNVRCKARGNFRKDNCFFPPIMINFKPDTIHTNDGFITKLKLVTQCNTSRAHANYVLKEYLIYKLWEVISPYALKTRLLDIYYYDDGKRDKDYHARGFFIEPLSHMASRTNTIKIEGDYFKDEEINALDADRVALFSYMIGNTDWRIKNAHNIKFIKRFGHRREEVTSIPYDFDHAGFVNADYASPSEWSDAKSVLQRDYCGRCRDNDENYHILIEEFLANEDEIYRTIMDFAPLDIKSRKHLYKYVSAFYKEIKKSKSFINSLHHNCMDRY